MSLLKSYSGGAKYEDFFPQAPGGITVPKREVILIKQPIKKVEILFVDSDEEDDKLEFVGKKEIVFESSDEESDEEENDKTEEKSLVDFNDPDPVFGLRLIKPFTLYNHQIEAINWMKKIENANPMRLNMRGGILAEEMGLGKTLISTSLCMTESQDPTDSLNKFFPKDVAGVINKYIVSHVYPNLIVCSKTVSYSWKREIEKFYRDSCPYFYMHRDSLKKNFDNLKYDDIKKYKIIITTYETVMGVATKNKVTDNQFALDQFNRRAGIKPSRKPSHEDCIRSTGGMILFKTPWRRIICDESHRFANPTSSTFYSMMALWGEKKWNLSGTPLRNYSSDLYSQFRFNGYNKIIMAKQFNYSEYERGRMIDFTLYKTYESAGIVLPPIKRHKIDIVLDGREKEIYDYYHSSMKQVYNGFLVGSYGFSNVLTLFLRLRQLCVAPYSILAESSRNYKGKDDEEYTLSQKILDGMTGGLASWVKDKYDSAGIDSAKMKVLISTLKSFNKGVKTLVFTSFKKVIDVAALAMDEYMTDTEYLILDGDVTGDARDNVINKFKNPEYNYSVLFISYKVGSEGLTLVEAENVIHMENWWTPVVKKQAERRVWRIGQTKSVNIYDIIITGSIEERIESVCAEKTKMIDDFKSSKGKGSLPALDATTIGRMIR